MNVYGSVGYTILKNPKTKHKIIIFADMHDTLPKCNNKIDISDWIKKKFKKSYILLEEVPRAEMELEELWLSEHTQQLKNLFLNNHDKVIGVDVRLSLIPYSWETIGTIKELDDFRFSSFIKDIDQFFCLTQSQMKKDWKHYDYTKIHNTLLGKHFVQIKEKYYNYLMLHKDHLQQNIFKIHKENKEMLEKLNNILNDIMEWTICALIYNNQNRPIVLHAGLYHTEKVIEWLTNNYNYTIITEHGVNKMSESDSSSIIHGCVNVSEEDNNYFEQ
jgi:hypothetical protein